MNKIVTVLFFVFFSFTNLLLAANGQLIIKFVEKTNVVGPDITLGDVADLIGNNKTVIDKLSKIKIGRTAPAGNVIKITKGYVRIVLRREGCNIEDFAFQGPELVQVMTRGQEFSPQSLLPGIKNFILKQIQDQPANVEVKVLGGNKKIVLPAGNVTASFRPSFSGKYEGSVLLTTELSVDGRIVRVLPLRVDSEIYRSVVTTTKMVEKGEKFKASNVGLVRMQSSKILPGFLQKAENVLGRTAAYSLPIGSIIRLSELNDPPVIKRAQLIQAIVHKGNIELSIQAKALFDGKAGDNIQVLNTDSGKVLHGKVLDEKTVLIDEKQ